MNCARPQTIISKIKSNMHKLPPSFEQPLLGENLRDESDLLKERKTTEDDFHWYKEYKKAKKDDLKSTL